MKESVIKHSDQKLDDAVYSVLQKGLIYALTPCTTRIGDFLAGVERAVLSLPLEIAEEARQETVITMKSSSRPRENLG